jgi:hypothetical protein
MRWQRPPISASMGHADHWRCVFPNVEDRIALADGCWHADRYKFCPPMIYASQQVISGRAPPRAAIRSPVALGCKQRSHNPGRGIDFGLLASGFA